MENEFQLERDILLIRENFTLHGKRKFMCLVPDYLERQEEYAQSRVPINVKVKKCCKNTS